MTSAWWGGDGGITMLHTDERCSFCRQREKLLLSFVRARTIAYFATLPSPPPPPYLRWVGATFTSRVCRLFAITRVVDTRRKCFALMSALSGTSLTGFCSPKSKYEEVGRPPSRQHTNFHLVIVRGARGGGGRYPPAEYTCRVCHYLLTVWRPNCRRLLSLLANRLHKINNVQAALNSFSAFTVRRNSRRFFSFYCFLFRNNELTLRYDLHFQIECGI